MYVDLNELWSKGSVYARQKKGPYHSFFPSFSPPPLYLYTSVPPSLPSPATLCSSSGHTQIYRSQARSHSWHQSSRPLSPSPVCRRESGCLSHFDRFLFLQQCCFFFIIWGGGSMVLLVFFIYIKGGGYVRAAFPHLGITKHTPPWHPQSPFCLSHPPLPSTPCLSTFVCTVWTIVLVKYYSTPPVGKYNSIFLCVLGKLYNSIPI